MLPGTPGCGRSASAASFGLRCRAAAVPDRSGSASGCSDIPPGLAGSVPTSVVLGVAVPDFGPASAPGQAVPAAEVPEGQLATVRWPVAAGVQVPVARLAMAPGFAVVEAGNASVGVAQAVLVAGPTGQADQHWPLAQGAVGAPIDAARRYCRLLRQSRSPESDGHESGVVRSGHA